MKNLLTCFIAAASIMAGAVTAGPVVQIKGGMTTIILDSGLMLWLDLCEVERIKPAVHRPDGSRWGFMVSGGVIDIDLYAGELEHRGGVSISCGADPERTVSIQNLRVEYIAELPVITGVVVVDDEPLIRQPLFTPSGNEIETSVSNGGVIRLSGVDLELTDYAASLLNSLLGSAYIAGDPIGEAISRIKVLPSAIRGNGKDKIKDKDDDDDELEEDDDEEDELEEEVGS
ncbi:MAG: hypothetical protein V7696_04275 [Halioglobus sp.]